MAAVAAGLLLALAVTLLSSGSADGRGELRVPGHDPHAKGPPSGGSSTNPAPAPPPAGAKCQADAGDPVRYISKSGNDGADGLAPGSAWATMQHAVESAPPGATVYLLKGSYPEFAWKTYTGRTGFVTFRPKPGDAVQIGGFYTPSSSIRTDWVAFDCLNITGTLGAKVRGKHVRFTNLRIPSSGIAVEDGSSNVLINGNDVGRGDPLPNTCIGLWSSYQEPKITDVTIRENRCEGLKYVGMNLRNFERVLVEDNLVAGVTRPDSTHTNAIRTYNGGSDLTVRGNVIRDNVAIGFFIKDGPVYGLLFENNVIGPMAGSFKGFQVEDVEGAVIANNTVDDGSVFQGQATGVTMFNNIFASLDASDDGTASFACNRHNLFGKEGNVSPGTNGSVATPLYVAGDDWRLQPGSPGVDDGTGTCKSKAAPKADLDGETRPRGAATDIGAYER